MAMARHALSCGAPNHEGDRLIRSSREAYHLSIDAMRADEKKRYFRIDVAALARIGDATLPSTVCSRCIADIENVLRPKTDPTQGELL